MSRHTPPYRHWLEMGHITSCLKQAPVDGFVFRDALLLATLDQLQTALQYAHDMRGYKTRRAAILRRIEQITQQGGGA